MSIQMEKDIFISGRHTPIRSRQGPERGRSYKSESRSRGSRHSSQQASLGGPSQHSVEQQSRNPSWEHGFDDYDHGSEEIIRVTNYHTTNHLTGMDSLGRKSVTFNSNKFQKDTKTYINSSEAGETHNGTPSSTPGVQTRSSSGSMNGLTNGDVYESVRGPYNGTKKGSSQKMRPKKVGETQWYTRPIHLGAKEVNNNSGLPARSISPINRPDGTLRGSSGSSPAQKLDSSTENSELQNLSSKELDTTNNTSLASSTDHALVREYFPVTLGASYEAGKPLSPTENGNSSTSSLSPPVKGGLTTADLTPWKVSNPRAKSPGSRIKRPSSGHSSTSSRSRSRKSRPSSAQSSSSSASKSSLDKMYLMSVEAPTIGSSTVLLSSPYQSELARLRMERLRIEEEHLLEVKRQEELERIRGPKPKWYELKSPQFHYEAHKNNSLISNKDDWQALLDYRTELEKASKQFQNAYSAAGST